MPTIELTTCLLYCTGGEKKVFKKVNKMNKRGNKKMNEKLNKGEQAEKQEGEH